MIKSTLESSIFTQLSLPYHTFLVRGTNCTVFTNRTHAKSTLSLSIQSRNIVPTVLVIRDLFIRCCAYVRYPLFGRFTERIYQFQPVSGLYIHRISILALNKQQHCHCKYRGNTVPTSKFRLLF